MPNKNRKETAPFKIVGDGVIQVKAKDIIESKAGMRQLEACRQIRKRSEKLKR